MSGIDEQRPELKCDECEGTEFYKVDYGAITSRIDIDSDAMSPYEEGIFQRNDGEDWQCYNCYTIANVEIEERINKVIAENEV